MDVAGRSFTLKRERWTRREYLYPQRDRRRTVLKCPDTRRDLRALRTEVAEKRNSHCDGSDQRKDQTQTGQAVQGHHRLGANSKTRTEPMGQ